jgi:acetyl esterase/lipase
VKRVNEAQVQSVVQLYDTTPPSSGAGARAEVEYAAWGATLVRNVVDPSLTVFLPDPAVATGTAVVIAPGGGFCWLTWDAEGTMVAEWLRGHGVAAFVLKYRTADLGSSDAELEANTNEVISAMLELARVDDPATVRRLRYPTLARVVEAAEDDARAALRHVREHAVDYAVAPDRIGFLGFSAGGILTMGVAMHHDAPSRPDFIAPVYGIAHEPIVVPDDAPPMFFVCALDDEVVVPHASEICEAWRKAGKSVESHVYSQGGHGFGMRAQGLPVDSWIQRFFEWLDAQGFLTAASRRVKG